MAPNLHKPDHDQFLEFFNLAAEVRLNIDLNQDADPAPS